MRIWIIYFGELMRVLFRLRLLPEILHDYCEGTVYRSSILGSNPQGEK